MLRANQPGCLDNSSVGGTTSYACIPPQLGLVTQPNYGACLNWRLAPPRIVDRISSAGFWPMPAMVKNVLRCSVVSPSTNVPFLEIGQSVNQRTHEPFFDWHCLCIPQTPLSSTYHDHGILDGEFHFDYVLLTFEILKHEYLRCEKCNLVFRYKIHYKNMSSD